MHNTDGFKGYNHLVTYAYGHEQSSVRAVG